MLSCEEALELISAALDGALTADETVRLEAHLRDCAPCRALYADFQSIHNILPTLTAQPPADLTDRIMTRVREEKVVSLPNAGKNRWRRRSWGSLVAVLAVVVLGAGALRMGSHPLLPSRGGDSQVLSDAHAGDTTDTGAPTLFAVADPASVPSTVGAEETGDGETAESNRIEGCAVPTGDASEDATAPQSNATVPVLSSQPPLLTAPRGPRCMQPNPVPAVGETTYCGILTLSDTQGLALEDYSYEQIDCKLYYTLPAADFEALVTQTANREDAEHTTQDPLIAADAVYGLVIVVPA